MTEDNTQEPTNQIKVAPSPVEINFQNFPIGKRAQTKLAAALSSTKDPKEAITHFQEEHSLHSYLAKAFGTTPLQHAQEMKEDRAMMEPIQPESVLTFLQHLNVSRYEVHKTIADTLKNALENEVLKKWTRIIRTVKMSC